MPQLFKNNASGTLASAVTAAATTMALTAGHGARFPAISGGDYFLLTLYEMSGTQEANHEIVKVTGRATDTLTVVRAQEGTTARAWGANAPVELRITAGTISDLAAISGGGGGLTNFAEAKATAEPNATVPVVSLSAIGAETNIDLALVPKGSGAFVVDIPDGTAAGGNKRGAYAVDLQMSRISAWQVAAGPYSVIIGGSNNRADGGYSAILGGRENTANSSTSTICGGELNNTYGFYSAVLGGYGNTSSGTGAVVIGGFSNTAMGEASIASGAMANTLNRAGSAVHAYGSGVNNAQRADVMLTAATSDATPVTMSASIPFTESLPAVAHCRIRVVAVNSANGADVKSWNGSVLAYRPSGGTLALLGTTTLASDAGASSLSTAAVTLVANTTSNNLLVNVTGVAGKSLKWIAHVEILEKV